MSEKSSFLRNLSGSPAPPLPHKMPSITSRSISHDDLSNSAPNSGRSNPSPRNTENSNYVNSDSFYPSADLQVESAHEITPRRPRRADNGSSRQSAYALDANHAKGLKRFGRQRRLKSLLRAECITDWEDWKDTQDWYDMDEGDTYEQDEEDTSEEGDTYDEEDSDDEEDTYDPTTYSVGGDNHEELIELMKAMVNLLGEPSAELQAAKDDAKNLKAEHDTEKRGLLAKIQNLEKQNTVQEDVIRSLNIQVNAFQEEVTVLQEEKKEQEVDIAAQSWTIETLKAAVKKSHLESTILVKEKLTWQQKLDGMHNRLHHAERKLRCLDHLTGAKLDARQSGRMADIKRNPSFTPNGLGSEILNQVTALNSWIRPTAQSLARDLVHRKSRSDAAEIARAIQVLGESMSGLVDTRTRQGPLKGGSIVLQTLVEIFLVHWATMIIEGWYPKQRSFADILAELAAQNHTGRNISRIYCGVPLKILGTTSSATDFANSAYDILQDFKDVVKVAGVTVPIYGGSDRNPFFSAFRTLVEKTWAVRTSIAERDLCGNMELAVVAPETLFQAKWMEDLYATPTSSRNAAAGLIDAERVAGTCRLGLQIPATVQGASSTTVLVLKPKVVLLSTVKDSR